MARPNNFISLIAANIHFALGWLNVFAKAGLHCARDVSWLGINDIRFSSRPTSPLTTVKNFHCHMGIHIAETVLDLPKRTELPVQRLFLEPQLVIGKSPAPPNE